MPKSSSSSTYFPQSTYDTTRTFGGDRFQDIIGEISFARDFGELMSDFSKEEGAAPAASLTPEERRQRWQDRVDRLAKNLLHNMSRLVDDPVFSLPSATVCERQAAIAAFEKVIKDEADELKAESYGVELLHAIGYVYTLRAKQYLGR
jgi:hypothetical protein